ncbi:GlpM family protein [Qiania dongpingensis]|uniref:GlpM family protein n=1 Tax=Qiania dongpingensis TaxID=2763669 RepID=A0A7G9G6T9_9FIRM|nr:GlpM family protein [Qiania dongpingensis]QNM06521.1 GlpM family protein [Qiania dongpingensis]
MILFFKCAVACLIMTGIHFVSKTENYFISGLMLSFPGLSMIAYYFMYLEQGAGKVRNTLKFATLSTVPFAMFLVSLNFLLKKHGIVFSLLTAGAVWLCLAFALTLIWKKGVH